MTTLTIIPNWKNKTARFKGAVAAGEHVAVTIQNDNGEGGKVITDASTLRLRVIGFDGRTLAIFPEPVPEGETPEAWGEEYLTPLTCTLNLNTVQMLKAVPPGANVPLLWVLDDYENKTLYFKEWFEVCHWPRIEGVEEPTNLDDYADLVEDVRQSIADFESVFNEAKNVDASAEPISDNGRNGVELRITGRTGEVKVVRVLDGAPGKKGADSDVTKEDIGTFIPTDFSFESAQAGYLQPDGTVYDSTIRGVTDYIELDNIRKISVVSGVVAVAYGLTYACFYDAERNFISSLQKENPAGQFTGEIIPPADAKYVRFSLADKTVPAKATFYDFRLDIMLKQFNFLLIGSSYGVCSVMQFPFLVADAGINICCGNLYKSTVSLPTIAEQIENETENGWDKGMIFTNEVGEWASATTDLDTMLRAKKWDCIAIQRSAADKAKWNAEQETALETVVGHIRDVCGEEGAQPQIVLNTIFAGKEFSTDKQDQCDETMAIVNSALAIKKRFGIDITNVAMTVQNVRLTSCAAYGSAPGTDFHDLACDGNGHLDYGVGSYVAGLALFEQLIFPRFGKSVLSVGKVASLSDLSSTGIVSLSNYTAPDDTFKNIAKTCALATRANPYEISTKLASAYPATPEIVVQPSRNATLDYIGAAASEEVQNTATVANEAKATANEAKAGLNNRYTKIEVDTKIASVQTFSKSIVETLPDAASADDKTIYLVPRTNSETPDLCDEYVVVEESGAKRWERIGGTTVDVDGKRDIDDLTIYTMAPWKSFGQPVFTWDESKNAWSATNIFSELGYAIPKGSILSYDKTEKEWKVTVPQSGQSPKVYTVTAPNDYAGLTDHSFALSLTITNVEVGIEGMEPDTRDVPITRSTAGLVATSQKLATADQVSGLTSQVSGLTSQVSDKRDKTDLTVYDTPVDWYYDGETVFVWDGENRMWRGSSTGVMGSKVGGTYLEYDETAGEWLWWQGSSSPDHISAPESTLSLDIGGYTIARSTPHVPFGTKLATTADLSMKASPMASLTWTELKALRDGGTLVPGMRYRITDYETTCNGKAASDILNSNDAVQLEDGMASVAGAVGLTALPFDIIVMADSENVLNENAQATARAGHDYGSTAPNFAAWRLSYCLDNDTARFTWADTTNGKGVVYRLVDEWGNDCPYDFKNIVFRNRGGALSAEDLIHRWSFNNSLEDTGSIGGMTATLKGSASLMITDADSGRGCARVNAGDPGTSWVELGANPIPASLGNTPFTIEVWATPREIRNYASIFALGNPDNNRAFGLMGVFNGYRQARRESDADWGVCWQALGAPMIVGGNNYSVENNVAVTSGSIAIDTPYYFAFVVNPVDNGYPEQIVDPATTITGYVYNAQTGELVGKSMTYTATAWAPDLMVQSAFNLGTTPWNNANPGADYDEVRVWKQALTPEQIADNVKAGPDATPNVWRYTFTNPSGGDTSLAGRAAGNVVEMCTVGTGQCLNRVVFTGSVTVDNKLGRGCAAIYAFGQTRHNTFGSDSACLVLGSDCLRNSFGPYTRNCSFGDGTYRSRTGSSCSGITTEFQCQFDIGSHCSNIYLDKSCRGVTIGSECSEIRIGTYVLNTMVGNGCQNIELGFMQYSFRSIEFAPNTQNVKLRYTAARRDNADKFVQHIDVSGFSGSTWVDVTVSDFLQTRRTSFVPGAGGNGVVRLEYPTQSGTLMVAGS